MGRLRRSCATVATDVDVSATGAVLARVLDPAVAKAGLPADKVRYAVLNDPEVLGSSLDIIGAYLKNYEVDKAAQVAETVLPICRVRGGLWQLKILNHLATVRMKQARPDETLSMLKELEAVASACLRPDEYDEACIVGKLFSRTHRSIPLSWYQTPSSGERFRW